MFWLGLSARSSTVENAWRLPHYHECVCVEAGATHLHPSSAWNCVRCRFNLENYYECSGMLTSPVHEFIITL